MEGTCFGFFGCRHDIFCHVVADYDVWEFVVLHIGVGISSTKSRVLGPLESDLFSQIFLVDMEACKYQPGSFSIIQNCCFLQARFYRGVEVMVQWILVPQASDSIENY